MKRAFAILTLGLLATVGSATNASALALTPADTTCTTNNNSNITSSATLIGYLDPCFDVEASVLTLLYKQNVGGGEEGTFTSSYSTSFTNTSLDPQNAYIRYVSGPAIACVECYLVVKDGNQSPAQYFFDISGWNGVENIDLTGFWPGRGAISNVAIWGGPSASVPEPGSLLLIGTGLGIAVIRRRRRQAV